MTRLSVHSPSYGCPAIDNTRKSKIRWPSSSAAEVQEKNEEEKGDSAAAGGWDQARGRVKRFQQIDTSCSLLVADCSYKDRRRLRYPPNFERDSERLYRFTYLVTFGTSTRRRKKQERRRFHRYEVLLLSVHCFRRTPNDKYTQVRCTSFQG